MINEKKELPQAVALTYDDKSVNAPRIVAKGRGIVAENILNAAKTSAVPIYQNKSLTQMLMALEIDNEIPTELYQAVAEILAYVYRADKLMQMTKNLNPNGK